MTPARLRPVCVIVALSLAASACQTIGTGAPGASSGTSSSASAGTTQAGLSPEESRLRDDSGAFDRTVAEGAVAGAVVGALIGGLVGRGWRGAAIGAGAGALVGGGAGAYVASQQRKYADEEKRIDAMTADVRADNEKLQAYLATAEEVIAADRQRLADLEARFAQNQVSQEELQSKLARIRENSTLIGETVESLRTRRDEYAHAVAETRSQSPDADLTVMDREIAMLESQISVLESDLNSLNEALAVSPVAGSAVS